MKLNIFIYIFCTAFYSIDSHCIQVKLKNFKVNHIIFAIPKRFPLRIPIFGRCGPGIDRVLFFFSKIPSPWGYFNADCGHSQTSTQASSSTAILPLRKPTAIPPQTTQLPVEIAEVSIFTASSTYRTAGDVSMIDSLENFRIHVSCFPSGVYE